MISGFVRNGVEAVIGVVLNDASGRQIEVEAVVDTGFTNYLTLPYPVISSLGFPWSGQQLGSLADGSERLFDYYSASVIWDNEVIVIPVNAMDSEPLVGMALLEGYDLHIEVVEGGAVTIESL